MITAYLSLPIQFLVFWFFAAPKALVLYFFSLNRAFLAFLSLPLYLRTFFKPLKNEYRSGLVGFSIGMGMAVKSLLIIFDVVLFLLLLVLELLILAGFLFVPFGTVYMLFI